MKLSWAPPEDDGGTPVLRYLIRLMDLDCAEWITACEVWRKKYLTSHKYISSCSHVARHLIPDVSHVPG